MVYWGTHRWFDTGRLASCSVVDTDSDGGPGNVTGTHWVLLVFSSYQLQDVDCIDWPLLSHVSTSIGYKWQLPPPPFFLCVYVYGLNNFQEQQMYMYFDLLSVFISGFCLRGGKCLVHDSFKVGTPILKRESQLLKGGKNTPCPPPHVGKFLRPRAFLRK